MFRSISGWFLHKNSHNNFTTNWTPGPPPPYLGMTINSFFGSFPFGFYFRRNKSQQTMTLFCIFSIYTRDKGFLLGNIALLTFETALKSWRKVWMNNLGEFDNFDNVVDQRGKWDVAYLDMFVHLHQGRMSQIWEFVQFHRTICHLANYREGGKSCLRNQINSKWPKCDSPYLWEN